MHLSVLFISIFLASGFLAGLIDSVVGGSGVITLPILLWAGLPAHVALGTNKLAGSFSSSTGSWVYWRAGHVHKRLLAGMIPFTFAGALTGVQTVLLIDQAFLNRILFVVIAGIAVLTVTRRQMGVLDRFAGVGPQMFAKAAPVAFALGFYDGFIGPGTGSFLLFVFISFFRFDFITAAGNGRVLNFASNIAALLLFAIRGKVAVLAGLPMAAGMMLGARVGAGLAVRRGVQFTRPLFVVVAFVLAVKTGITAFTAH